MDQIRNVDLFQQLLWLDLISTGESHWNQNN